MSCLFNSFDPYFKQPFGAVRAGQTVRLSLCIPEELGYVDPHLVLKKEGKFDVPVYYRMNFNGQTPRQNHFSVEVPLNDPGLYFYYFDLYTDFRRIVRGPDNCGVISWQDGESWQITVYEQDFETPESIKGKVFYQIFPDRFCEGVENKPMPFADRIYQADKHAEPFWQPNEVGGHLNEDYFGGDLKGIQQKLPYLHEMGVDFIYLNPIFEAHSNHRYNTADYLNVDPLLGTNEDFEALCTAAQKYGIGIVLDGVFSHTGSDSRYFNREGRYGEGGAYRDPNSPYRCWYDFGPQYKDGYRSWWGFETLPEVDEETPSYVEFITGPGGVIDTWLRRGAAGFRLDVADELPDEFIEKVRAAVKRVSPEKFLLGEGLDSVMNYPFKNAVLDFVKGKPAEQAMTEILTICEHYPAPAMDTALNFLSTHDTERALTVIADEPANGRGRAWQSGRCVTGDAYEEGLLRLRMAYAIIYTLPGVPCLYYGDEIAMQGYRDPFNRAFFRWDAHEQRLRPVLAQLAQLRHTCEAFRTGQLRVLRAEDGILHYQRVGKVETAEIIVNRTEHIIVETLASGKSTEVNPMGFTIVVEEVGHNPNHSYYDYV
ncbi:MAG: glycoside hydrolase family 13 protein [Faecalibacterium sp.]|nr:glycoside hydrolase family 13 protein [Faecalibacterium sp.]